MRVEVMIYKNENDVTNAVIHNKDLNLEQINSMDVHSTEISDLCGVQC